MCENGLNKKALYEKVNSLQDIISLMDDESVEVISFDIFDTLLVRPVGSPSDVFELLDKYYKELKRSNISFRKLRVEAESVLRRRIIKKEIRPEDIQLDDIYETLVDLFGMDRDIAETMKMRELELEIKLSAPRKSGLRLYKAAIGTGKRVVCISDMYLPEEQIVRMLEKAGFTPLPKLYISSETGLRKQTGQLYEHVIADLKVEPSHILHIGDNEESDCVKAGEAGIRNVLLPKTRTVYESLGCGNQVKKICSDLTNWEAAGASVGIGIMKQMAANYYFDDPFREFEAGSDYNGDPYFVGYAALGMELLALVNWIIDQANRDAVDKVIFMARDGYLPMRAYELIGTYRKLPEAEYLPVSRLAVFPAMISSADDFYDLPIDLNYQTPGRLLRQLGFAARDVEEDKLAKNLKTHGFDDMNQHFTKDSYIEFINYFIHNLYDEKKHNSAKETIKRYMLENKQAPVTENSALFDMGYSGRIPAAIMDVTGVHPKVYFFHTDSREHFRYEKCVDMNIRAFFDFNLYMESSLREYSYLEAAPSCIGYSEDLQPVYDSGPAEGYEKNAGLMQKGALDFIRDYLGYFSDFERETGFRAHDGAMPFEAFIRYCTEYDRRMIYDRVLIDDELWGGRRDIDLKWLMELRLGKIPEYARKQYEK